MMNLIMRNVEFPVEVKDKYNFVRDVFEFQNLCKVSEVSIIPYNKRGVTMNVCLIKVSSWCDSESGYNLMMGLKLGKKEIRVIYDCDNWWVVERNEYGGCCVEGVRFDAVSDAVLDADSEVESEVDSMSEVYSESIGESDVNGEWYSVVNVVSVGDTDTVSESVSDTVAMSVSEYEYEYDDSIPSLIRCGNYVCALCGKCEGGMLSLCNNELCRWYNKSALEISGLSKSSSESVMPPLSWLEDLDLDLVEEEEWLKISDSEVSLVGDVGPNVMPPLSWCLGSILKERNVYLCGSCGESTKGLFSICRNDLCERYNKSIDDIYEEGLNLDMKNVTLRKHQLGYNSSLFV
jgi:hypothetical protein